jgi:hypothetical protein
LVHFPSFLYIVSRKIWQPCYASVRIGSTFWCPRLGFRHKYLNVLTFYLHIGPSKGSMDNWTLVKVDTKKLRTIMEQIGTISIALPTYVSLQFIYYRQRRNLHTILSSNYLRTDLASCERTLSENPKVHILVSQKLIFF